MKRLAKRALWLFGKIYDFFSKIPKKTYETLAIILLAALLVVDLGYHLVRSISDDLETATAKPSVLSEKILLDSIIVRDELPLDFEGERYLFLCEEGERVQIGTELVYIYSDSADPDVIAALDSELYLEKLLKESGNARLEKLRDTVVLKIETLTLSIEKALEDGNLSLAEQSERELYALMLLRERLLGTVSLDDAIADNEKRIASLSASLGQPKEVITSPAVAWFSSDCDGYERAMPYGELFEMDQDALFSLFEKTPEESPRMKLVFSYKTYVVASIHEVDAQSLSQKSRYGVTLDGTSQSLLLEKTVFKNQSDRVALIFSTTALDGAIGLRRIAPLELTLGEHKGFKLPVSAITSVDGVLGVYILKGFRVEFREVMMVWRDGNIAVCASDFTPTAHRALAENDNVIVKGKELYDGKIVSRIH